MTTIKQTATCNFNLSGTGLQQEAGMIPYYNVNVIDRATGKQVDSCKAIYSEANKEWIVYPLEAMMHTEEHDSIVSRGKFFDHDYYFLVGQLVAVSSCGRSNCTICSEKHGQHKVAGEFLVGQLIANGVKPV